MNKIKAHHFPTKLMGCSFVITAVHENPAVAWNAIRAAVKEIERIEELISSWKESSQTSLINRSAGLSKVSVDKELYLLIERSLKISTLTCGAFDISGTLSRDYWNFNNATSTMLGQEKVNELIDLINYKNISLNDKDSSVFLHKKGMKIGFGGIGKGYAAKLAMQTMQAHGISNGLVNASGDLIFWGNPPQQKSWNIHIPNPRDRSMHLCSVHLPYGSVVTSGSYESFTIIDGKRYSHIVNPRSGMPVHHTKNVSVICPDPELGDALATAFSVLPIEESLHIANALNGVEALIVDASDDIHFSNQLKTQVYA